MQEPCLFPHVSRSIRTGTSEFVVFRARETLERKSFLFPQKIDRSLQSAEFVVGNASRTTERSGERHFGITHSATCFLCLRSLARSVYTLSFMCWCNSTTVASVERKYATYGSSEKGDVLPAASVSHFRFRLNGVVCSYEIGFLALLRGRRRRIRGGGSSQGFECRSCSSRFERFVSSSEVSPLLPDVPPGLVRSPLRFVSIAVCIRIVRSSRREERLEVIALVLAITPVRKGSFCLKIRRK